MTKLRFDVLKECTRHLDQPRPAGGAGATSASDARVTINLIHNVARPEREGLQSGATTSAVLGASDASIGGGDNATPVAADDNPV